MYRMMMTVLLIGAIYMAGCGTGLQSFRDHVLHRAAFELGCPASELTVADLSPPQMGKRGTVMGVSGCGNRGVYQYTTQGWVNTSVTDQKQRDPEDR